MGSALPIVSDCRASCDCTTTLNVNQLVADAVAAQLSFEDFEEARAHTLPFASNQVVGILGESTPGDGGEGMFYFSATSVLADDNATVLRPDNIAVGDPGRLIRMIL